LHARALGGNPAFETLRDAAAHAVSKDFSTDRVVGLAVAAQRTQTRWGEIGWHPWRPCQPEAVPRTVWLMAFIPTAVPSGRVARPLAVLNPFG